MPGAGALALTEAEIDRIGDGLAGPIAATAELPLLLLAVSGGVDSMALMHILSDWAGRARRARLVAATVDHGLRPESAEEARFVASEARRIGLAHVTLVWQGAKPATGIQEAARTARYRLLAGVYHGEQAPKKTLVTAHTQDDQAETVLMRLARGSGVEGLSGIGPVDHFDPTASPSGRPSGMRDPAVAMTVSRPLLDLPKSRLVATMRQRGLAWREDPSNENLAFERVRIRQAMPVLAGLGLSPEAIARSARRIATARDAVRLATRRALNDPSLVRIDPMGFAELDRAIWNDGNRCLGEAVTLQVLSAVVLGVGGLDRPLSLQALETLARECGLARSWHKGGYATTLGRTKITGIDGGIRIQREAGRDLPQPLSIEPGQEAIWDNRFHLHLDESAERALTVRPLGRDGLAEIRRRGHLPAGIEAELAATLPSFWDGAELIACPPLARASWTVGDVEGAPHSKHLIGMANARFRVGDLTGSGSTAGA